MDVIATMLLISMVKEGLQDNTSLNHGGRDKIFLNENCYTSIQISLKFIPKAPGENIPAFVQIMAWRRPGDKPLSTPMMA